MTERRTDQWKTLRVLVSILLIVLCASGCDKPAGFDDRLDALVQPYRFSILRWELGHILERSTPPQGGDPSDPDTYLQPVFEYFSLTEQIWTVEWEINAIAAGRGQGDLVERQAELARLQSRKSELRPTVEWILGQQVRAAFTQEGILNPADRHVRLPLPFPRPRLR